MCHWCRWHQLQIYRRCHRYRWQFATNVNGTSDTNGKFAASNVNTFVIDTGGAPWHMNVTANFWKNAILRGLGGDWYMKKNCNLFKTQHCLLWMSLYKSVNAPVHTYGTLTFVNYFCNTRQKFRPVGDSTRLVPVLEFYNNLWGLGTEYE